MDNPNYTTEHRKGQHLTPEERHEIEVRRKDGWSTYRIAKHLDRSYNTIKHEISRGTVKLYNGKVSRYKADVGEAIYKENRKSSTRNYRCMETAAFLQFVVKMFRTEGWSLDACVGRALEKNLFERNAMVCTKTLYNYVDLGVLPIKNIDLPEKLRRSTKAKKVRENKKNLGRSIEERPETVQLRTEFGHWEIDTVLGRKNKSEPVVMTLVERMTRNALWIKARNHTAEAINEALADVLKPFGKQCSAVFKSITGDNGSEFAGLSNQESLGIDVYFTHPYSSWEKGTNECHNKMLRRFMPKGKRITDYSADDILFFADRINGLPRKILGYHTPEELFEKQLDRIYAA
ncbi:MAG TPA: IS30 family transposase [Clostridia bacterium]|nr:IS30 family transposase [Clostridia bacterium]